MGYWKTRFLLYIYNMDFCQGAEGIKLGTVAMPHPAYHRLFHCKYNIKDVVGSRTAHHGKPEAQQRKTLLKAELPASALVHACMNGFNCRRQRVSPAHVARR